MTNLTTPNPESELAAPEPKPPKIKSPKEKAPKVKGTKAKSSSPNAPKPKSAKGAKAKSWKPWRDKHVESEIFFYHDPELGLVIVKRYRQDVECIRWLNSHLAKYYPPEKGLPVAQHEFAALRKLAAHGIAPDPIRLTADSVVMKYAGEPIHSPNSEFVLDYRKQAAAILDTLQKLDFKHNDLLPRNVLAHKGKIHVVDFTLSEFDGISIMADLPNPDWARPEEDRNLLDYGKEFCVQAQNRWERWSHAVNSRMPSWQRVFTFWQPPRYRLRRLAQNTYNYHNLGSGVFPVQEEKTPYGSGERCNFDRMYMMVSNYDFTRKSVMDFECNSGWFCIQLKLLGSGTTIGLDHQEKGQMGQAIRYAQCFERTFKLGINFLDRHIEETDLEAVIGKYGLTQVDSALVLSVLHHIGKTDLMAKSRFFATLYGLAKEVIFYEDHEFWNDLTDLQGHPIETRGEGYRFGWNEDLSWQQKIGALEAYGPKILERYRQTWRRDVLLLDRYSEIRFLGFSEKRRPMFAFFK